MLSTQCADTVYIFWASCPARVTDVSHLTSLCNDSQNITLTMPSINKHNSYCVSHRRQNNFSQVALNCNPGNHFALYGYFIFILFQNLQKKNRKIKKCHPLGFALLQALTQYSNTHAQTYRHQPELCQGCWRHITERDGNIVWLGSVSLFLGMLPAAAIKQISMEYRATCRESKTKTIPSWVQSRNKQCNALWGARWVQPQQALGWGGDGFYGWNQSAISNCNAQNLCLSVWII